MISLFVKSGSSAENMLFLSNNKRAFIHCEEPNYREIIEAEVSGQYITGLSNSEEARGESRRLKEYNEKVQALPEAYQILSDQLPLIGETVGNIRQEKRSAELGDCH
ncbi:metalloreductase transmembrane component, putative [Aspergillus udagawae]|uniref:Metalloreductase transmembrane component, putative n=1 Tax=Aspergillus udagawae TaxID=91492 RepID=A0A8H3P777_9EURO|nr:metalloreductase transmembrane component, putative [Aspergillus udagawae]